MRTRIKLSQPKDTTGGLVVGYSAINAPNVAAQIGAYDKAYSISEYRPNFGWSAIASAGLLQRQIASSHAVVAEISTRNPNVFYELGYAHALEKPAVLLVRRQDSSDVPFDLKSYRAIYYDDGIGGKRVVERNLRAHLEAVKRGVMLDDTAG